MLLTTGTRKCRVQGCQRKPLFADPGGDRSKATHCAAHRGDGVALQEGLSPQGGFVLQHSEVVHNDSANVNATSRGSNGHGGSSENAPKEASRREDQVAIRGRSAGGGGSGGRSSGSIGSGGRDAAVKRVSRHTTCRFPGCPKTATHGSQKEATHCTGHKQEGQIDHKHRLCEYQGPKPCLKQPSFGWPGESRKRFCGAHRVQGTVDLRNCEHEGCGTRASHGFGKGKARFCAVHSPPGTSIVANRPCEKEGCIVSPRFGVEGDRPRFCGSHKEKHMVNLKDRRCEHHLCKTQPTFALPGEKPRFCSKHKSEGHVNVRHKLCHHPQCKVVPTYGVVGTRVPVACLKHSDAEMVDLKRERMRTAKEKKGRASAAVLSASSDQALAGRALAAQVAVGTVGRSTGFGTVRATMVPTAENKRRRVNQSLGANPEIGRRIVDAIFASSQRVLEGEEAAATEESEWEEGSAEGQEEGEEGGDVEDEGQDPGGGRINHKEGGPGQKSVEPPPVNPAAFYPTGPLPLTFPRHPLLHTSMPPLLPPTFPAISKPGSHRRPFHESPLALLPGAIPRGDSTAYALDMVAAVAAASVARDSAWQKKSDTTEKDGVTAAEKRGGIRVSNERSPTPTGRALPEESANGDRDGGGASSGIPVAVASSSSSDGRSYSADSSARSAAADAGKKTHTPDEAGPGPRPGLGPGVPESGQQQVGGTKLYGNSVTSLTWKCVQCSKAVEPTDRHVLICCGYGLLHKACTSIFVHASCPCPKCFRLVGSSLQVFM